MNESIGLLDKKALAREFHVSVRTVENLMARRAIPYIKIGRVVRFDVQRVRVTLSRFEVRAVGDSYRQTFRAGT